MSGMAHDTLASKAMSRTQECDMTQMIANDKIERLQRVCKMLFHLLLLILLSLLPLFLWFRSFDDGHDAPFTCFLIEKNIEMAEIL